MEGDSPIDDLRHVDGTEHGNVGLAVYTRCSLSAQALLNQQDPTQIAPNYHRSPHAAAAVNTALVRSLLRQVARTQFPLAVAVSHQPTL